MNIETSAVSQRDQKEAWFIQHVWVHRPQLRNFIRRLNIAGPEADDLCQETFLRVWRAYDAGNCRRPKSVLFQTARNLVIDLARRATFAQSMSALSDPQVTDACDCLDPLRQVAGKWDLEHLNLALGALSGIQQAVIWYRRVEQLPEKRVAQKLRITVDRVDNQLRLAVRRLRAGRQ